MPDGKIKLLQAYADPSVSFSLKLVFSSTGKSELSVYFLFQRSICFQ